MLKIRSILTAACVVLSAAAVSASTFVDYNICTTSSPSVAADIQSTTGDTWTFSDTTPLITGGTGGQNGTVYGGVITTWSGAADYNPVLLELNADRGLQVQVIPRNGSTTTAKGVWLWKKQDFLSGSGQTIKFVSGDSISLNLSWSQASSRETRMVVNQGGTYYVSQYSSAGTGTMSVDPTATQWAVLNTSNYTWGAFSALSLSDIRAVGLYFNVSRTADFNSYRIGDFQVIGTGDGVFPLKLANIFTNGCVLQRDKTAQIWGSATPGAAVTVNVNQQTVQAVTDSAGKWLAQLAPEPAGGPYALTVTSDGVNPVTLTDVYFGDVWLLTGQSNMFQLLRGQVSGWPDYYLPAAPNSSDNYEDIRFCIIDALSSAVPVDDITLSGLSWQPWKQSSSNLGLMSTVGYYFIHALKDALAANGMGNVPIGVIKVCRGATAIEEWTSPEALAALPETLVPNNGDVLSGQYNGMIRPIQNYAFKGVLWYQGENNANSFTRIQQYPLLKKTLVESWRSEWGFDFPFYFVQLAPYREASYDPVDSDFWPWMRESQTKCLTIPNTAMACIIDAGTQDNIHPPFKDKVGQRLARIALANTYGFDVVSRGPTVSNVAISGSVATITFDNVADGLETLGVDAIPDADEIAAGNPPVSVSANILSGFMLCGSNKKFYWATEAVIIGKNQVRVSSPADVPNPVAVRYAWQTYPRCNLFNSEGLPAEPFRTDSYAPGSSTGGALTRMPLQIYATKSGVSLEWLPASSAWVLESSADLTANSWVPVSDSSGRTNIQLSDPSPIQPIFFRMRPPTAP